VKLSQKLPAVAAVALTGILLPTLSGATDLVSRIIDDESGQPVASASIRFDDTVTLLSNEDGTFRLPDVAEGAHRISVSHVAYASRTLEITWPLEESPLVIRLQPAAFEMEEVTIEAEVIHPWFPVSATTLTPEYVAVQPGNIANDPLRTIEALPSAASTGLDFNSGAAIRGGDTEEHRVYFDGFPLDHYTHVGGYTSVVYDDLLEGTTLIPGGTPLRYRGNLSGAILLSPVPADENRALFRYDVTSMGLGGSRRLTPSLSVLGSAKPSFFTLPAYRPVGVDERSFRDGLARFEVAREDSLRFVAMILAADDDETGSAVRGIAPSRSTRSFLSGVRFEIPRGDWTGNLRLFNTYFRTTDDLSDRNEEWDHRVTGSHASGEIERRLGSLVFRAGGEVGRVDHEGHGGDARSTPVALAAEGKLPLREGNVLVLGVGGSREPWTSAFEPEGYASLTLGVQRRGNVAAGYRRSHQTPFLFTQRKRFATIPIDAGDLLREYEPSPESAKAVSLDQVSVQGRFDLTRTWIFEGTAYLRWYENLPAWRWSETFEVDRAASSGSGEGSGYEITLRHLRPGGLTFSASLARSAVDKQEGSLSTRRPGDFDLPHAIRLDLVFLLGEDATLALAWQDLAGRPFTELDGLPPDDDEVNARRFSRYQRLDVKIQRRIVRGSSEVTMFLDVSNLLGRKNVATVSAVQLSSGEYVSGEFEGITPFPVFGFGAKW
jgi:hypothetical protein